MALDTGDIQDLIIFPSLSIGLLLLVVPLITMLIYPLIVCCCSFQSPPRRPLQQQELQNFAAQHINVPNEANPNASHQRGRCCGQIPLAGFFIPPFVFILLFALAFWLWILLTYAWALFIKSEYTDSQVLFYVGWISATVVASLSSFGAVGMTGRLKQYGALIIAAIAGPASILIIVSRFTAWHLMDTFCDESNYSNQSSYYYSNSSLCLTSNLTKISYSIVPPDFHPFEFYWVFIIAFILSFIIIPLYPYMENSLPHFYADKLQQCFIDKDNRGKKFCSKKFRNRLQENHSFKINLIVNTTLNDYHYNKRLQHNFVFSSDGIGSIATGFLRPPPIQGSAAYFPTLEEAASISGAAIAHRMGIALHPFFPAPRTRPL